MTVNTLDDVGICNIALRLLGVGAISSLTQNSDIAATCADLYPITRDTLLSLHDWNFARNKRQLDQVPNEEPLNCWANIHALPSDLIAGPFAVWGDGLRHPVPEYDHIGDTLQSNYSTIIILYRCRPSITIWPPYFCSLVATALAAAMAKPVTDNDGLTESLTEAAYGSPQEDGMGGIFGRAKTLDAKSRPNGNLFANGDLLTAMRF